MNIIKITLYTKSTEKKVIIIEDPHVAVTPHKPLSQAALLRVWHGCVSFSEKSNDLRKMKHFGFILFCTVYLIINSGCLVNIVAIQMVGRLMALTRGRNSKELSK